MRRKAKRSFRQGGNQIGKKVVTATHQINTYKLTKGIVYIAVKGSWDAFAYGEAEDIFLNLLRQKRYKLIVDLSETTYISSAAVGILFVAAKDAILNHGQVIIYNPKKKVKKVLELLGCSQLLSITNDMKSAIKKLSRPACPTVRRVCRRGRLK